MSATSPHATSASMSHTACLYTEAVPQFEEVSPGPASGMLESLGAVLDHVAHAVPSARSALPLYRDVLGGRVFSAGIDRDVGHIVVKLVYPQGGIIELIQPIRPDSQSVGGFLKRYPQGGLHHITFKVPDVAAAAAALAAAGYHPFGTRLGVHWQETFLHPRETGGVLIQLGHLDGDEPGFVTPLEDLLAEAEAQG